MFQYVVMGVAAAVLSGIAYKEASKPTGEKVKYGDAVFVRADALKLADANTNQNDVAGLRAFLAGFINTAVKVTDVRVMPQATGLTGSIIGFPRTLFFERTAVQSIERNGKRIV
jgi:hypothetical protein